jgi:hypothetical protein
MINKITAEKNVQTISNKLECVEISRLLFFFHQNVLKYNIKSNKLKHLLYKISKQLLLFPKYINQRFL